MGLYERDYMRAPRDERPTWPPRRSQLSPLTWILCILATLGIARYAYVNLEALQRLTGTAPMAQPRPAPMEPTPVPERNPFPDDPTWRTGPRVPMERVAVPESRLQTVFKDTNPRYHRLIETFGKATGVPVVMNTSFNLKGEPIVNTPAQAYSTFSRSGMDMLVLDRYLVEK